MGYGSWKLLPEFQKTTAQDGSLEVLLRFFWFIFFSLFLTAWLVVILNIQNLQV